MQNKTPVNIFGNGKKKKKGKKLIRKIGATRSVMAQ